MKVLSAENKGNLSIINFPYFIPPLSAPLSAPWKTKVET